MESNKRERERERFKRRKTQVKREIESVVLPGGAGYDISF
jgi:hypothetical protein